MHLRILLAGLALLATTSIPLRAQQSFIPGAEANGQISVQVNVTLNDGLDEYGAMPDVPLTLYRGATDSMSLRTDGAGVLRFAIAPGTYRLSTPEPVRWHGRSYRWNVPLEVQRRMGIVNLTAANATIAGGSAVEVARASSRTPARAGRDGTGAAIPFAQKDGSVGVLFGFLLTGGGQFYAGNNTKGAILLGLSLAEVVAAVSVVGGCDPYCTDSQIGTAQLLLLPAVFNWVYGMATAPGDVRRWNEEHQRLARVRPVVEPRDGRTGVGLAVGF
ncbi:MAG TPA: hypothetical protein VKA54_21240 [Gemmatimonadaceae bacterium]|nr:hypothetical protein [Gemmatimonadaceae bacterium]